MIIMKRIVVTPLLSWFGSGAPIDLTGSHLGTTDTSNEPPRNRHDARGRRPPVPAGTGHHLADLAARAKRYGQGYCLVLIDLDHFKDYNDEHGHQAGDGVLAQIAGLLSQTVREEDRAYRYGGEELLLVLRDQDLDAGRALAERHRAQVQRAALPHSFNAPHGVVTLSAGVAAAHPGETPEQVLRRADKALYEAKALGRNRIAVTDPDRAASHPGGFALAHA
jgi:diguanylate cyclase (GGDEF)-like protein